VCNGAEHEPPRVGTQPTLMAELKAVGRADHCVADLTIPTRTDGVQSDKPHHLLVIGGKIRILTGSARLSGLGCR
jgi:hypothetical protein